MARSPVLPSLFCLMMEASKTQGCCLRTIRSAAGFSRMASRSGLGKSGSEIVFATGIILILRKVIQILVPAVSVKNHLAIFLTQLKIFLSNFSDTRPSAKISNIPQAQAAKMEFVGSGVELRFLLQKTQRSYF